MTRADELLAELRRQAEALAGLRNERGEQDPLYLAWRDLDDFMSSFGVLPQGWQVRIGLEEHPDGRYEVPEAARKKLVEVIWAAFLEQPDREELGGGLLDRLARAAAHAVAEAVLEERRQLEVQARHSAVYGLYEAHRTMTMEGAVWFERSAGVSRQLTPDEVAELERRTQDMGQPYCTRDGSHGGHQVGTSGLYCPGRL